MKRKSIGFMLFGEFAVMAIVFALAVGFMGNPEIIWNFVDIPSLLLILLFSVPMMFLAGTCRDFFRVFSIGKKSYKIALLKRSLEAVRFMEKTVLCSSLFSVVIASIIIMADVSDLTKMGSNLAVAFISIFYCVIIEIFLITMKVYVQNAVTEAMDIENEEA